MKFSEREGFKTVKAETKLLDQRASNRAWNWLENAVWELRQAKCHGAWQTIWTELLAGIAKDEANDAYFAVQEWWENVDPVEERLDVIEFVFGGVEENCSAEKADELKTAFNQGMAAEHVVWRLHSCGLLSDVSNDDERAEIEQASMHGSPASTHIREAVALFGARKNVDMRNVVKESFSALESALADAARRLGKPSATTSGVKDNIDSLEIDGGLRSGFKSLYGWASQPSSGVRHGLLGDGNSVSRDDARFFLIISSAFVNWLESSVDAGRLELRVKK